MRVQVYSNRWARTESILLAAAIGALALLIRLVVIDAAIGLHTPVSAELSSDSQIHIRLTQNLLAGRGYSLDGPTAITPPLYIFFLTGMYWMFDSPAAVRLAQAVMGAGSCVLLYAAGLPMVGHRAATAGAVIMAVFPLPAYLAGLHLTENLFLLLLLLVMWQAAILVEQPTPVRAVGLGALTGLAALTRAAFLGFLPFLLAWMLVLWRRQFRQNFALFGLVAAAAMAIIAPWTIRNFLVLRTFVPVQSNGGMVFWAGNNPFADGGIAWPTRTTWTATSPPDDGAYGWRHLSVGEENAMYVRTAVAWIRAHPEAFLRLLLRKVARVYGLTPARAEAGLAVNASVLIMHRAVLLAALAGLVLSAHMWRSVSFLLALIVFTNFTVLLFSGATRYLVPMVPSLALFGGVAMRKAWDAIAGSTPP